MQHSEKELSCFLLWKSQCNPLVFMDFYFFTPNEAEKSDQFNKKKYIGDTSVFP